MNRYFLLFFLSISSFLGWTQDSRNITLLDHWTEDSIFVSGAAKVRFNECWGFTRNNIEYAVIGANSGAYLFQIENNQLEFIQYISGTSKGPSIIHRDYHDYGDYLYAVTDEGNGSLQIMDLTYLPDSVHLIYDEDSLFKNTHNIFIDTSSAKLYACGPSNGLGMSIYSLENPIAPSLLTHYLDAEYVHDAYVIRDTAYLNCAEQGLKIVDFSNPTSYNEIASLSFYIDQGYNHSGWRSPDGKTYIFCDETVGKRLKKCDLSDFPNLDVDRLFGTNYQNESVAHNIMLTERFAVVSYYQEGLRIYDYTQTPIREVAHYDTFEESSIYPFSGAWGVYVYPNSSHIIVSDRQSGLYLFDFDQNIPSLGNSYGAYVYPNPLSSGGSLTFYVNDFEAEAYTYELFDMSGKKVYSKTSSFNYLFSKPQLASGVYSYSIRFNNQYDEAQKHVGKIVVY